MQIPHVAVFAAQQLTMMRYTVARCFAKGLGWWSHRGGEAVEGRLTQMAKRGTTHIHGKLSTC